MAKEMTTTELLLHPVRWRIVQALMGRELTTGELGERLTDVATTTLYRQMSVLADRGIVEVVAEERIRGTVQRTYALATSAQLGETEAASLSPDEHRQAFGQFVAGLLADFERYLGRDGADPVADHVNYSQAALHLDDAQLLKLGEEMGALLKPYLTARPGAAQRRLLLSTVLIPDD